jgi:hypothetical protein
MTAHWMVIGGSGFDLPLVQFASAQWPGRKWALFPGAKQPELEECCSSPYSTENNMRTAVLFDWVLKEGSAVRVGEAHTRLSPE